jgi:signal transduction histidine kinase
LFVSITSVLVPLGGETVVVSQFLDITERKSAELELLRSREELQRSSEQLHELTTYLAEARENERTGIARELHDQLGQALTALSMDLDGVRRTAVSSGELPVERLDRMAALLEETVSDVRRISSELRPGILDDAGLVPAIEWQLDRFRERSGVECRLVAPTDDAGLDRAASTALFRVFQELLTNIARHSAATRVQVTFERTDGEYVLSVADNGRGITQAQVDAATSLGIIGMRERLRPLHGTVEFRRRRPRGTTVLVTVPAR